MIHTGEAPPCWDVLEKAFGVRWVPGIFVTYGAEIYCFDREIPDEFLIHEMVHVAQQRLMDKDEYVQRFINDLDFRKRVEKEAFIVHEQYLKATIPDEAQLFTLLHRNRKSFARTCGCSLEEADHIISAYNGEKILP